MIQNVFRLPLPARCHGYYVKFTRRIAVWYSLSNLRGASNIQATKLCLYSQEFRISDTVYGTLYYFYELELEGLCFIYTPIYTYNASFGMHTCRLRTSDKIWIVCLICTFCNSQYTVKNKYKSPTTWHA